MADKNPETRADTQIGDGDSGLQGPSLVPAGQEKTGGEPEGQVTEDPPVEKTKQDEPQDGEHAVVLPIRTGKEASTKGDTGCSVGNSTLAGGQAAWAVDASGTIYPPADKAEGGVAASVEDGSSWLDRLIQKALAARAAHPEDVPTDMAESTSAATTEAVVPLEYDDLPEVVKKAESRADFLGLLAKEPGLTLKGAICRVARSIHASYGQDAAISFLATLPPGLFELVHESGPISVPLSPAAQKKLSAEASANRQACVQLASKPKLPEFGAPVTVAGDGRVVCKGHLKAICRDCEVDYTGVELMPSATADLSAAELETSLNHRDVFGGFIPVFSRSASSPFAAQDARERAEEYPSVEEEDMELGLDFDTADLRAIPAVVGPRTRFVPQWEAEVMGTKSVRYLRGNYRHLPTRIMELDELVTVRCGRCHLTWLQGHQMEDQARSHPSHHAWYEAFEGARRSIIVLADGAFVPPVGTATPAAAAVGVFFADASRYNASEPFSRDMLTYPDGRNSFHPGVAMNPLTPQLAAVVRALQIVRQRVVPDRVAAVAAESHFNSGHAVRQAERFRVVLCIDSAEVVDLVSSRLGPDFAVAGLHDPAIVSAARRAEEARDKSRKKNKNNKKKRKGKGGKPKATKPMPKPKPNEDTAAGEEEAAEEAEAEDGEPPAVENFRPWDETTIDLTKGRWIVVNNSAGGSLVPNSDGILMVQREIAMLACLGVSVSFFLVPSKSVAVADKLARAGLNK